MFTITDKRQDIRFTKQISVTSYRISNLLLNSMFCIIAYNLEKTGGGEWLSVGATMGAGGGFGPPVI